MDCQLLSAIPEPLVGSGTGWIRGKRSAPTLGPVRSCLHPAGFDAGADGASQHRPLHRDGRAAFPEPGACAGTALPSTMRAKGAASGMRTRFRSTRLRLGSASDGSHRPMSRSGPSATTTICHLSRMAGAGPRGDDPMSLAAPGATAILVGHFYARNRIRTSYAEKRITLSYAQNWANIRLSLARRGATGRPWLFPHRAGEGGGGAAQRPRVLLRGY